MDRVILHCDMNGFFASVELLDYPELVDKPMAVCGNPESRHGIILAKNEIAKKYGVVTAETIWQARKKCPSLVLVPPHHDKYRAYSEKINKIYLQYTDMVEPFSIDESWLDVTASQNLFGNGKTIADKIREQVKEELHLTLSAGVSYNKIFAKMGSEYKKPDATTVISRDNYKELLWPMDVSELFFCGFATAEKLKKSGINTIGELASTNPKFLTSLLGSQGKVLWEYANGLDESPVCQFNQREKIKSVGNGITFKRNLTTEEDVLTAITALSHKVAYRLRHYGLKAGGVKVDIKDPKFRVISRQQQFFSPTNLGDDLKNTAMAIIKRSWHLPDPIRLLTVTAINLTDENEATQLSLFDDAPSSSANKDLEEAMDKIKGKFGDSAITFGQILDNDIGVDL